jgi:hypothetical protein
MKLPLENKHVERVLSLIVILYGLWLMVSNAIKFVFYNSPPFVVHSAQRTIQKTTHHHSKTRYCIYEQQLNRPESGASCSRSLLIFVHLLGTSKQLLYVT